MSTNPPTPLRARDHALLEKQALRVGLELCGLSVAQLADCLGVEDDTVEAWVSPTRPNHVPAWIERHPRLPRVLRDFLRAERDRSAGDPPVHGAETPEAQARVVLCATGQLVSALAAAGSDAAERFSPETASQLSRIVDRAITTLTAFSARLRQRRITGGYAPARGAS